MENGVIKEGQFERGKLQGWGRIIYSDCYEIGWFSNDKIHGYGIRAGYNDVIWYCGQWKNGIKSYI